MKAVPFTFTIKGVYIPVGLKQGLVPLGSSSKTSCELIEETQTWRLPPQTVNQLCKKQKDSTEYYLVSYVTMSAV